MKKLQKPIKAFFILFISFFLFKEYARFTKDQDTLLSKISSRIFEFNEFEVKVSKDLFIQDFEIKNINSGKVIYENGKFNGGVKNEYGNCVFQLYYQEILVFEIGHTKYNNWHTHEYLLEIKKTNGILDPTLSIKGPDGYRDFYYKRFEKRNEDGFIKKTYLNKAKEIYHEKY